MWTLGRSNKQAGSSSKKATDVPNLKTLELTGDLIGHSGAVQVGCHTCLQSLNIDGLTVLFLFLTDVYELRGERFNHMLNRPPADTVEERTQAVTPAQPRSVPETGRGRRTVTCEAFSCASKNSCVAG